MQQGTSRAPLGHLGHLAPWDRARDWLRECDRAGVVVTVLGSGLRTALPYPLPSPEVAEWVVRTLEADGDGGQKHV
jgi:hypothetical protein